MQEGRKTNFTDKEGDDSPTLGHGNDAYDDQQDSDDDHEEDESTTESG